MRRGAALLALAWLGSAHVFAADIEAGRVKAEVCVACHGANGNATLPGVPTLAAQPALHTFIQLVQFREKRRNDPQMAAFVEKLTNRDMQDIGAYFSVQKAAPPVFQADAARAVAGRSLLDRHYCGSCHMPDLSGQNQIPRLAGQNFEYLVKQMRGLKDGSRRDIDGTMASAAQALSDQDIENLAHYLASLQ